MTHLVRTVEGRLREGVTLAEILAATFPGGSVTGAPKIAALDLIAALEPVGRGASMGALCTFRPSGDFDLALTIRTFAVAQGRIHLWVGGGSCGTSEPEAEIEESWVKARRRCSRSGRWAGDGVEASWRWRSRDVGLVDPAEPVFLAGDDALLRGRAAFETTRVYGGRPPGLADHVRRLRSFQAASLARSRRPTLRRVCATGRGERRSVRPDAGRCRAPAFISGPAVTLIGDRCAEIPACPRAGHASVYVRLASLELDVGLDRPSWLLPGVKSTSYAVNMAAEAEAQRRGADDAVFLAEGGVVLEAPISNIWWRLGRDALHPASTWSGRRSAGPASTRATILELAPGGRLRGIQGAFTVAELRAADEAFTSSSIREVLPVVELDRRADR